VLKCATRCSPLTARPVEVSLSSILPEVKGSAASKVAVIQDPAGNLKPAKNTSKDRIDGIIALIMAIARSLVQPQEKRST
jgi:hypothetical protein